MNIIRLGISNQSKPLQTKMLKKKKYFLSWVLKNCQMTTRIFIFVFQSVQFYREFKCKKVEFRKIHQVIILL